MPYSKLNKLKIKMKHLQPVFFKFGYDEKDPRQPSYVMDVGNLEPEKPEITHTLTAHSEDSLEKKLRCYLSRCDVRERLVTVSDSLTNDDPILTTILALCVKHNCDLTK